MNPAALSSRSSSAASAQKVFCSHCQLPVPAGLIEAGAERQFCCGGCRTAYELIHSSGLGDFYRMAGSSDSPAWRPAESVGSDAEFLQFDESAYEQKFVKVLDDGTRQTSFSLDGIHCAACVWLLEKLPRLCPGVVNSQVSWARRTIQVTWVPEQLKLSRVARTIRQLGYTPHPIRESDRGLRRRNENRQHLVRIGVAGAAAGNNMLIAAALYLGMFSTIAAEHTTLLRWASCCVGLFSLLWPGRVFLQSAWNALRTRTAHMDLPVALGLVTGSTAGLINTILGRGEIYFDSLSVLIFLLLVARWIQFRQQSRAADAVELLFKLTPPRARRRRDGVTTSIPVDEVSVGDTLEILPGDLVPVDAVVLDGASQLDESILSGESRPAHRAMGDTVSAGTKNLTSLLVVRTLAVGQDTRISRIVELVEQAALSKPAIVEWANRIGGVFVVVVTLLAAITLAAWLIHSPEHAVDRAVSLLIVACPCALALATPLAISVAIGRLARRKIMVKAGDVFQSLDRPGQIWLDKTGTVTEGRLSIVEWFGDELWRSRTAIAERQFIHPIADAFRSFQVDESMETSVGEALQRDGGIQATAETGRMLIGNRRLLEDDGVIIDRDWDEREQEMLAGGLSPCWISYQGRVVAMAGIGDRMRDDSGSVIEVLRSRGWRVGLLSGDHPEIVGRTGRDLGLEPSHLLAGVTPEQKLEVIELAAHDVSPVVMVGDGVNDSAALAAATVGIAVHSGAEASLAAAPVFLAREGLSPVLELIDASRSTCRIIRWNFAVSLTYNFAGAGLAMFGLINPLVAALLMPVSSLTVVAISLRAGQSATRR